MNSDNRERETFHIESCDIPVSISMDIPMQRLPPSPQGPVSARETTTLDMSNFKPVDTQALVDEMYACVTKIEIKGPEGIGHIYLNPFASEVQYFVWLGEDWDNRITRSMLIDALIAARQLAGVLIPTKDRETDEVTRPDLDTIEKRANAATPGPWQIMWWHDPSGNAPPLPGLFGNTGEKDNDFVGIFGRMIGEPEDYLPNREFCRSAREDIPALIAEVRSLRAENAELRKELEAKP